MKATLFENEVAPVRVADIRVTNDGEAVGKEKIIFRVVERETGTVITEISNGVSQTLKTELLHGPATARLHIHPEKAKSIHHGDTRVCMLIAAAGNDKQDMEPD